MGGLPGQVAARVGADGRHHIEVLISRDLSPADRDGVLFEELNNVDEYIYSSRHETDPINHPLIDTVTVGDYGGRALVSYEMYLRNTYDKGLPMFADLSDPSLGYALKVETINDDRFVDSVVLHDGVPETVTLYANTNSSVQHPNASAFVAVRPAFYLSTHTGYATTASMGEVSNHFKSYVDLSRVRFQFSMDPTAKFNQGGEPAPGKHRPVSDSWTSFDITLENLSSLQLNTGAYLPNIPILLPMLWDLTTWSTDLSGRPSDGAQFSKSPSFTYQSGLATGATDRPSVANVDNRSEALQSQIDILQAKKTRATTDLEKNELDVKLTQANLEMTQLNNYKHQLIDLADNHSGHLNYSAGARLGGYFFGLHDITRPVDTGIDVLDNNALGTELSGGLGAASAGLARAAGLGFHEASGTAAVVAFGIRTASQISATTSSEILFNQDLALFDNNGINSPQVLRKFGLGIGPDGQPNSQLEKYLSLVEAGQSAGLTPLSRSWLLGFAAQGFAGLQVKKDIAVMKAPDRLLAGDVELDSRESVNRLNNHEIDFAQVEINFRNQNPSAQINPPPGPGGSNHNFVYDPHHFEFNIGFFVSAGERFDVTTAGTRVVSGSGLEVPIWQQGVMGI
jgi:hypothetical protein